jgi:hypothetical protein
MRKGSTTAALAATAVLAGVLLTASPASAVQSRPTYVAQADPLCLAAIQQEAPAAKAWIKAENQYKSEKRTKRSSSRFLRKTLRFLTLYSSVETNLNTQLSAVPVPAVPPADPNGPTAIAWVQKRGEAIGFLNQGIVALKHRHARAALSAADQYDAALKAAHAMVADWGFHYCV